MPTTKTTYPNDNWNLQDGAWVTGDADDLYSGQVGGKDTFHADAGVSYATYYAAGDALYSMYGTSKGGADIFHGSSSAGNNFYGDAQVSMVDSAQGGDDSMDAGTNSTNNFVGDAASMAGKARGGNDTMTGGGGLATLYPSSYYLVSQGVADNYILGDAADMGGSAVGGRDTLTGGNVAGMKDPNTQGGSLVINTLVGDAATMGMNSFGGADALTGGNASGQMCEALNILAGDAMGMTGAARGGNDTLTGGSASYTAQLIASPIDDYNVYVANYLAGDAFYTASSTAAFGTDVLRGGSAWGGDDAFVLNVMVGDVGAQNLEGFGETPQWLPSAYAEIWARLGSDTYPISETEGVLSGVKGGNDSLVGGDGVVVNLMLGDAMGFSDGGSGGWDTLTGGGLFSFNLMVGDALSMNPGSHGGNDRLVSGAGADLMVGDAFVRGGGLGGADSFVFSSSNGYDTIVDFNAAEGDKIVLTAFKRLSADFSSVSKMIASERIQAQGDDLVISTNIGDQDSNGIVILGGASMTLSASWFVI